MGLIRDEKVEIPPVSPENLRKIRNLISRFKHTSPFIIERDAMIIDTFLNTGIRRNELTLLKKQDFI
ncbi:MAG: hypothetical protein HQK65_22915, partial [Desulfamplus sp.]|nr:hypothetical protein [Desulfamplus sp.]